MNKLTWEGTDHEEFEVTGTKEALTELRDILLYYYFNKGVGEVIDE